MDNRPFPFFRLPLELRENIYSLYFNPFDRWSSPYETHCDLEGGHYTFDYRLLRASKQIYNEAQTVYRRENVFVKVETPWPTTVNHISSEGRVPIVIAGPQAVDFRTHSALIQVSAPGYASPGEHPLILLLDDLHLFTQTWYYSALSYRDLNSRLTLSFTLRDPHYPADPKPTRLALQKKILLPFEHVKGLLDVEFEGGWDEKIKDELMHRMSIPYPSVEKCIDDCAAYIEEGDRALAAKNGVEAMALFVKAMHAIHIIVVGRCRRVLADHFFHTELQGGRYGGKHGEEARVLLRVKIVARVCAAHLVLQQWCEAAFWGMRTIGIMRNSINDELQFESFAKAMDDSSVGLIYLRTAIAFKKMEGRWHDDKEVREEMNMYRDYDIARSDALFPLAAKFIEAKHLGVIKKELEEHRVRVSEDVFKLGEQNRMETDSMSHLNLGDVSDLESELSGVDLGKSSQD